MPISSNSTPLAAWQQWRAARATKLVAAMWPLLQQLEEANKAWLLVEIGALAGELSAAVAQRSPWRDVMGCEEEADLLKAAVARYKHTPESHRLDWCRCALGREGKNAPRLPLHTGYASGAIALGIMARHPHPEPLVQEIARVVRPKGSLLLGEPVGAFLRPVPAAVRVTPEQVSTSAERFAASGFAIVARAESSGVAWIALKRGAHE